MFALPFPANFFTWDGWNTDKFSIEYLSISSFLKKVLYWIMSINEFPLDQYENPSKATDTLSP